MILCERKNCINNQWNMFWGYNCKDGNVSLNSRGSCTKYVKASKDTMVARRKKYGFKGVY